MIPPGYSRLTHVAKRAQVTVRCLKRRFKKLDERLRAAGAQPLLVRFSDGDQGHLYVDVEVMMKHLPAYLAGEGNPCERAADNAAATLDEVREMRSDLAAIRAALADRAA